MRPALRMADDKFEMLEEHQVQVQNMHLGSRRLMELVFLYEEGMGEVADGLFCYMFDLEIEENLSKRRNSKHLSYDINCNPHITLGSTKGDLNKRKLLEPKRG